MQISKRRFAQFVTIAILAMGVILTEGNALDLRMVVGWLLIFVSFWLWTGQEHYFKDLFSDN